MLIELNKVKVSTKERERLLAELSNWDNLSTVLSRKVERGEIDIATMLKMIKVEVTSRKRLLITTRLLAVYHKLAKRENERRVTQLLSR